MASPSVRRILGPRVPPYLVRQPDPKYAELAELAQDVERELGGRGTVAVAGEKDLAGEVRKGSCGCTV